LVQVQSIFSEDAKIGILLEYLEISFNDATILKSNRLQMSRIPTSPDSLASIRSFDLESKSSITCDCIVQGSDICIIVPHRLQLRAIEDVVEDMLRGLKLVMAAKKQSLSLSSKKKSKDSNSGFLKVGAVKFSIREIITEIEEEPIQGWLDEHYRLMKNEVCELSVWLRLLDEALKDGSSCSGIPDLKEYHNEKQKKHLEDTGIDLSDQVAIRRLQERLAKI